MAADTVTWRVAVPADAEALADLGVHPAERGRGLAREAIARTVAEIGAGGREPVLWCLAGNTGARAMYEHLGWVPTGRTTNTHRSARRSSTC